MNSLKLDMRRGPSAIPLLSGIANLLVIPLGELLYNMGEGFSIGFEISLTALVIATLLFRPSTNSILIKKLDHIPLGINLLIPQRSSHLGIFCYNVWVILVRVVPVPGNNPLQ